MALARNFHPIISQSRRLVVITGAGVSTDSGIPDYRSPGRPPHKPIQHQEFIRSEATRQRYWARSLFGYPNVYHASPNITHQVLAAAEAKGLVAHVITQNVDALHQKAGSSSVINLHGNIHEVICMECKSITSRATFQDELLFLNPEYADLVQEKVARLKEGPNTSVSLRPDGDLELSLGSDAARNLDQNDYSSFKVPPCHKCNGRLKPHVVFFGDNVSKHTVDQVEEVMKEADGLLVLGSSLTVWSSFRLVRRFIDTHGNDRVGIVNDGPTRADPLVQHRLHDRLHTVLPTVFDFESLAQREVQKQAR